MCDSSACSYELEIIDRQVLEAAVEAGQKRLCYAILEISLLSANCQLVTSLHSNANDSARTQKLYMFTFVKWLMVLVMI